MPRKIRFNVMGTFTIPDNIKISDDIIRCELADGRMVLPFVTLEVYDDKTGKYDELSTENEMLKLGFDDLVYERNCFEEMVE